MKLHRQIRQAGFTLIELLVAIGLGLLVVAAATQLFKVGIDASAVISQRAEMQQNIRVAVNMITKDVSMAGAGLPTGGLQLPSGNGSTLSFYARDQAGPGCYLTTCTYPNGNYMYGVVPGALDGVKGGGLVPATNRSADSITVAYVDYSFPLNQYVVTFPDTTGNSINLALPSPAPVPALPAVNDPAVGMKVGDLVLLSNNKGTAVGEVTSMSSSSLTFAGLDALNMNQSGAQVGNIAYIATGTNTVAYRLLSVSYFLEVPTNGQLPRLMRQVSGHTAVPVADNIIDLQFSYDLYNEQSGANSVNQKDPLAVAGLTPNEIRKVNVWVMAQSMRPAGNKSQNMELVTSVSTRNLAFRDRYK
jgi:prepilin-type N-terminal cleavage/methylation domain-containing protein